MLAPVRAPLGAPNVLVVLIDDAGFGNPETFGGPVDDTEPDARGRRGLRYNRFHVTAVCSPTRAATLTGRNHHRSGSAPSASCRPVPRGTRPSCRRAARRSRRRSS